MRLYLSRLHSSSFNSIICNSCLLMEIILAGYYDVRCAFVVEMSAKKKMKKVRQYLIGNLMYSHCCGRQAVRRFPAHFCLEKVSSNIH